MNLIKRAVQWCYKREPALTAAALAIVANTTVAIADGTVDAGTAIRAAASVLLGLLVRRFVTPTAQLPAEPGAVDTALQPYGGTGGPDAPPTAQEGTQSP